jgi:putative glycosyltransferase (TIGR04348 family)
MPTARTQARPKVAIITPYAAASNTGNWHTAARWARFLRTRYRVDVATRWDGGPADALIALHARRSAASIQAFAAAFPKRPLVVVLTGTDLYRDIAVDRDAQRSLASATRLVVLNGLGPKRLPTRVRHKAEVILQSAPALAPGRPRQRGFDVAVVGHLRDEKDPQLVFDVARSLPNDTSIRILHAGNARDRALAAEARRCERATPHYRWLGELSRGDARQLMRRAQLLLHPSKMEGGAQAVIEAITAGTAVVASDIDGNAGLLGADYAGLFPVGDAAAATALLQRAAHEPKFLAQLRRQCARRAPLFAPRVESAALHRLLDNLLRAHSRTTPS